MTNQPNGPSKALLWSGVGVGLVGVAALVAVAVTDLGKADQIASVVGAVLAAAGLGVSLWALRSGGGGGGGVTASGERAVAAGGSIGVVVTGDRAQAPAAPPAMPSSGGAARPGPVTASGDRSVAAGGDIGSVSTGDA
ncbi:hypothetical protein [Streptomyces sp. NPDC056144]|uniref:hypothetical protein n=1 Tax=unclassified Streptomyces TaxID=2593676 RepID=UPI0035D8CECE